MRKPRRNNIKSKKSKSNNNNGVFGAPFFLVLFLTYSVLSTKLAVSADSRPVGEEQRNFKRPDPLRNLKNYNGSYDVRDKHYWASAAFTGVFGYAIAALWLLCGFGFGVFIIVKKLITSGSCNSKAVDHSDHFYLIMFIFVVLLTFLAIIGTSVALASNENTLKRTKRLKNTIVKTGEGARDTIYKVMNATQRIEDLLISIDENTAKGINQTRQKLGKDSRSIDGFVQKFGQTIDRASQTSYLSHLVVVTVNMVLVVSAIVLLLFHWHPGFLTIIFLCWILTSLCWGLAGIDFFMLTFAEDTCSALEGFLQNPLNNSLSSLLPCMDSSASDRVLLEVGSTIHNFVGQLNSRVNQVKMSLGVNEGVDGVLGFARICDPFSGPPNYTYIPENCPPDAIRIGDIPVILSEFKCSNGTPAETCQMEGKFIPQESYDLAFAYSHSAQHMLDVYPDLRSLTQCTIVKDTFSDIVKNQCKPFRVSVRLLWSSVLALSIFMVALILFWVTSACQEKGRCFKFCSIIPISRQR